MPNPENIAGQGFHTNPERINKKGRPAGRTMKSIIQEIMNLPAAKRIKSLSDIQEILGDTEKLTNDEALVVRMLSKALSNPDGKSADRLMNHGYGMPKQTTEQININTEPKIQTIKDGKEISLKIQTNTPSTDNVPAITPTPTDELPSE